MARRFPDSILPNMLQYFGSEVALAYNVLNTTNYWAIALVGGLVTALLADGTYPTPWRVAVVAIGIVFLTRFLVRSCLRLLNMYRWNKLNQIVLDYLGGEGPREDNVARLNTALELYYYKFFAPIPWQRALWESLKLAYFWLFLVLLILLGWGWVKCWKNHLVWAATGGLLVSFLVEAAWFFRSHMFRYVQMPASASKVEQ